MPRHYEGRAPTPVSWRGMPRLRRPVAQVARDKRVVDLEPQAPPRAAGLALGALLEPRHLAQELAGLEPVARAGPLERAAASLGQGRARLSRHARVEGASERLRRGAVLLEVHAPIVSARHGPCRGALARPAPRDVR